MQGVALGFRVRESGFGCCDLFFGGSEAECEFLNGGIEVRDCGSEFAAFAVGFIEDFDTRLPGHGVVGLVVVGFGVLKLFLELFNSFIILEILQSFGLWMGQ